eukprot:gene22871-31172_t
MEMDALSVHWHGIDQLGTPWSDGSIGVTNCPIPYGRNQTYTFSVLEAGTFWYHLHIDTKRGDGGYGMLIVDEETPIAIYDSELEIILSDYYHQDSDLIKAGVLAYGPTAATSPSTGFTFPGVGQSILFNGLGNQPVYLNVQKNMIYRVRIVNAANLAYFNLAIAGHNLTLIGQGSTLIQPVVVKSIDIAASQRFDFLLNTRNMLPLTYQISIVTNWRGLDVTPSGLFNKVYLRYAGSTGISPLVATNEIKLWNDQISKIKPLGVVNLPKNVTKVLILDQSQQYVNAKTSRGIDFSGSNTNGYLRWTVNEVAYTIPGTPFLLASYYEMMGKVFYPPSSKPIRLEIGDVVDVVVQNRVALNGKCESHPFHLHGSSFWILGQGAGLYTPAIHDATLNLVNPLSVDTFVLYATSFATPRNVGGATFAPANAHSACGWTKIRFVANNPGFWQFHCHVEWHMAMGNMVVFDVANELLWAKKGSVPHAMGLSLPSDYIYCGLIDAKTPDPHNCLANWSGQCSSDSQCCDPGAFCNFESYRQCQQPQVSSGKCQNPSGFSSPPAK